MFRLFYLDVLELVLGSVDNILHFPFFFLCSVEKILVLAVAAPSMAMVLDLYHLPMLSSLGVLDILPSD